MSVVERAATAAARRLQGPLEHVLRVGVIRTVLHRRAVRAWRGTDTPLILCYGNINRSPFAAALARRRQAKSPGSAGFFPVAGRASPDLLVARAAGYGVDLSGHRSRVVDRRQLERAPAIFVFDLAGVASVACRRLRALRRTHLVALLSPSGTAIIDDPHGQPPEALDAVLERISQAIS